MKHPACCRSRRSTTLSPSAVQGCLCAGSEATSAIPKGKFSSGKSLSGAIATNESIFADALSVRCCGPTLHMPIQEMIQEVHLQAPARHLWISPMGVTGHRPSREGVLLGHLTPTENIYQTISRRSSLLVIISDTVTPTAGAHATATTPRGRRARCFLTSCYTLHQSASVGLITTLARTMQHHTLQQLGHRHCHCRHTAALYDSRRLRAQRVQARTEGDCMCALPFPVSAAPACLSRVLACRRTNRGAVWRPEKGLCIR